MANINLFKDQHSYWSIIRKVIIAFGGVFSDMTIVKKSADGKKDSIIRVPIAYGPKHKWLSRLKDDPDLKNNVETVLPRLSFEITDYRYDASRKIGTQGNFILGSVTANGVQSRAKIFNPVPYDVTIQMHSMCKSQEDSLQILEQVLPYFAPAMTVNVEMVPEYGIKKDVPILLQGVTVDDGYEGSSDQLRTVIQTFTFVAQLDLFGPITATDKVIKKSFADVGQDENLPPSAGGSKYAAIVNPVTANETDPHVVDESWIADF